MVEQAHNPPTALDHHLFGPGRKRILSLDGGGVRGALSVAFLERLEDLLADIHGKPVRLCDFFDLIGGTSTGSIIATSLALGFSAKEIRAFYEQLAPKVFRRSPWRMPGWSPKFDAAGLRSELASIFGDRRLDSQDLQTGLSVVLKRVDTGGAWILLNNRKSAYWNTPSDRSFIGNAAIPLAKVVRASTAAPHYFDPELIEIVEGHPAGLFLDGGLTPHNNPSLILFLAAMLPAYGLEWKVGAANLTIVSVGTGGFRTTVAAREANQAGSLGLAIRALAGQSDDSAKLVLLLMSWLGETSVAWPIDSELGDLGAVKPPFGTLFGYHRLDVMLEAKWLADSLGETLSCSDIRRMRGMDDPANVPKLYELGRKAAQLQLRRDTVSTW